MKMFTPFNKSKVIPILLMSSAVVLTGCGSDSDPTPKTPIVDTVAPVITLTGDASVNVNHNDEYTDAGASATDNVDGAVSVTTNGNVDTASVGEYILTYTATDAAGNEATSTRTVTVVDVTAPVITLTGDASITIFQNTTYTDEGATAIDAVDSNVNVVKTGTVNETVLGKYVLTYTATDAAGNESTLTRTITVTPAVLSGTAAGGAAIVGTVVVKGANGKVKSSVIEADGSYEVDVTGLTAPYRLRAEGTVGGKRYKLHSYTEEASVDGTVNITPFTDLIIANTAHQLAESFFDSNTDISLDAEELSDQEDALQAKLQNVFDALGLDAAIDLLNSSFNADHSGLDAALDLISIETGDDNIATITNLLDDSSIIDDITNSDDNDVVIEIDEGDADDIIEAVSDTVAIAAVVEAFTNAFSDGLPQSENIADYFGDDFLNEDQSLAQFFSDILTDPEMIGISFNSLSVNDLDSDAGTAMISFTVAFNGVVDPESEQWFVAKDETLGWQLLGDQQMVNLSEFHYHCNSDGLDAATGGCGINTSFRDNDFNNNGTDGAPILSASVSVVGADGTVKDTFYIGTADNSSEGHIYNEGQQQYTWDWREFGSSAGDIDPSLFSVGDIIKYSFYAENLDLSSPSYPAVVGDAVTTYSLPINHEPQLVGKYPAATQTTIDNMSDFVLGEDITIAWTLADGTQSGEVLVQIDDPQGGYILGVWTDIEASTTSLTVDSAMFNATLIGNNDFDPTNGYTVIVRIYAEDSVTGQEHSTDYRLVVDASTEGEPDPSGLTCGYSSGWNEYANDGLGAPIMPNSFADFVTVSSDCGTPAALTKADFAGIVLNDDGETGTFNDDGSATKASPSTGTYSDGDIEIDFEWYIETIDNVNYLIVELDKSLNPTSVFPADYWFRETRAVILESGVLGESGATYNVIHYSEQSNYSDDNRFSGSDAEIWSTVYTQE